MSNAWSNGKEENRAREDVGQPATTTVDRIV